MRERKPEGTRGKGKVSGVMSEMNLNIWKGWAGEIPLWGSRQWAFQVHRCIFVFSWLCLNVNYVCVSEHTPSFYWFYSAQNFCRETGKGVNFPSDLMHYGLERAGRGDYECLQKLKYTPQRVLPFQRAWNWGFQPILSDFKILGDPVIWVPFFNK